MPLLPIVFWSATVVGFLGLLAGILWREPVVAGVGALLSALFCVYVALSPMPFGALGLLALAGNILAVVAVVRGTPRLALLALGPFVVVVSYLGWVLISSGPLGP